MPTHHHCELAVSPIILDIKQPGNRLADRYDNWFYTRFL
jgi:hypothetical protein